jgi:antitoxin HigA-1
LVKQWPGKATITFPGHYFERTQGVRVMDKALSPIHPGEILLEDFMKPLNISQYRLAKDIGVPAIRISQITRGDRSITVDTAMRLARYFGTSASVWLRLQVRYDLEAAKNTLGPRIEREVKVLSNQIDTR